MILVLLLVLGHPSSQTSGEPRAELVIRNISVLDLTTGAWLPGRDLIIRGTRVSAIRATGAPLPLSKFTINGDGKFAIPGLFDNRVRLAGVARHDAARFVAHGVTSVFDAGTDASRIAEWRRDISYGKFMGPRILDSDGNRNLQRGGLPATDAASAAAAGTALHDALAADVRAGHLTPVEAVRRATIRSAEFHGRAHDLGSIEEGKIADVIVLDGNPLTDIANLRRIDAVVFRGETLTRAHLNILLQPTPRGARY